MIELQFIIYLFKAIIIKSVEESDLNENTKKQVVMLLKQEE